jgi:hypothetical protein
LFICYLSLDFNDGSTGPLEMQILLTKLGEHSFNSNSQLL